MTSDFRVAAIKLEQMVINIQPEDYDLAKKYLLKREAHDIIEMLGL
jgi:hypothetical protein